MLAVVQAVAVMERKPVEILPPPEPAPPPAPAAGLDRPRLPCPCRVQPAARSVRATISGVTPRRIAFSRSIPDADPHVHVRHGIADDIPAFEHLPDDGGADPFVVPGFRLTEVVVDGLPHGHLPVKALERHAGGHGHFRPVPEKKVTDVLAGGGADRHEPHGVEWFRPEAAVQGLIGGKLIHLKVDGPGRASPDQDRQRRKDRQNGPRASHGESPFMTL